MSWSVSKLQRNGRLGTKVNAALVSSDGPKADLDQSAVDAGTGAVPAPSSGPPRNAAALTRTLVAHTVPL